MSRQTNRSRLRHAGPLALGPGVVWRDERGWRFACPLGCYTERGAMFESAGDARAAAETHWIQERERELAEIAKSAFAARGADARAATS